MRRSVILFLAFLAIISLCSIVVSPSNEHLERNRKARSGVVEEIYTIDVPQPRLVRRNGGYVPVIEGYEFITETHLPMLPYKTFFIEIPDNAKNVRVTLMESKPLSLGRVEDIALVPPIQPISKNESKPKENKKIKISGLYPRRVYEFKGVKHLRQHDLAVIDVYPIQYDTGGKELFFSERITLRISYEIYEIKRAEKKTADKASDHFEEIASKLIINYKSDTGSTSYGSIKPLSNENESDIAYIIITNSSFVSAFQPLAEWKTKKGVPARIYNLSWIYENYNGTSNYVFYSGNGNNLNNTMQTVINLTAVTEATLSYVTQYNIEYGWDFGYIEASTDNISWEQLNGTYMTTYRDPSAYVGIEGAPAYTGDSAWVQDTINLSNYTGNVTYLRFRYVTDNALVRGGWYIDNITIDTDQGIILSDNGNNSGNWIMSGFSIGDTNSDPKPEAKAIRNFIKYIYNTYGVEWVLLGGDTSVVPYRGGYGYVNSSSPETDSDIPADLYYSDLDRNWNFDLDSTFGETTDYVDLMPDVFVGRAPVDTIAEVQVFVNKTLTYEKNPLVGYENTILFLAGILDDSTDGASVKDIIDDNYIPSSISVKKLYESSGNLNHDSAKGNLSYGYNLVNHIAHANQDFLCLTGQSSCTQRLSKTDADTLSNSMKYSVFYSVGCYSNAFDNDTISEHFMNNANGGTVAYTGNSRSGWYSPGSTNGPSDKYDKEFFKSLFNDGIYHIGKTLADSKITYISQSSDDGDGMRWLQYAINLLGDPELPIWTDIPKNLTVDHPSMISPGRNIVTVRVTSSGGDPVENATVCLHKVNEIYVYDKTDSDGNVTFNISPSTIGDMDITVTAHNFIPYENSVLVRDMEAPIVILDAPLNGTVKNNVTITFFYTPNETISTLENCSLYGNFTGVWALNQTDTSPNNGVQNNFTINLTEGKYIWNVECSDNSNNSGFANTNWTITLDLTPPTVSFLPPTPGSGVETDFSTIVINVSHAEVNPDTLILNWNGTPESYSYSGGYTVITKVVANGFYTYYVWLNDSAGNWNQTEVRNLTVNATPPAVVLVSPDNGSFSSGDVNFTCNATDNAQLSSICLYWDYSGVWGVDECKNISGTSNSSTFIRENLSDSRILWNCYACDNSSNCAFASGNFTVTVDTTMPSIVGYSINPKIVINGSNVSLFMNVTDLHLNRTWAVIELPDSSRVVLDPPADYTTNITGRHNVTFFANDSAGNEVNISDYFISKEGMQFNSSSISYNNSGLNVTLRAYFDGSLIAWNQSIGDVVLTIANYTYDLQFATFNNSLIVLLRGVNLSENNNRVIGFDRLDLSEYLVVYAINNSYVIENATLNLSYSGTGYTNENYLEVYKCGNWNFLDRNCSGSWQKVSSGITKDTDKELFTIETDSFSAFSIKQESAPTTTTTTILYRGGGGGGGHGGGYGAKPMPSCFDGIQNCHDGLCEMGVDCGGPCKPCPSCTDGIQNQGEEGIDCGGPCPPCPVTTITVTTTSTTVIKQITTPTTTATTVTVTSTIPVTTTTMPLLPRGIDINLFAIVFAEVLLIFLLYLIYTRYSKEEDESDIGDLKDEIE